MVHLAVATVIATLFFATSTLASDEPIRPFQIFQLVPQNEHQLLRLIQLYETGNLDFWRAPTKVNATVDLMVDGRQKQQVESFAANYKIPGKIIVEDLEKMLEEKEGDKNWRFKALKMLQNGRRDILDVPDSRKDNFGMDMADYHGYDEIVSWMRRIEQRMPNNAKMFSIGKSVEGRDIWGIKLANPVGNPTKRVVWIDGGIHAREWTSVFTTTYLIYNLVNGILQNDAKLSKVLETIDIVVFPVLNPDGYEFTRSDPRNALVRMWRKNRSKERCATNRNGENSCCKGVDLNRNFDYRFAETGTSFHPCSEIYHGAGAFSEPETRAVRDAILSSELTGRISAFISLHAYSQLWIYPYSNKKQNYPADVADLKKVAQKAVNAIGKLFGTRYLYGTGPETIYAYTGGSCDWAKETAKIKYSYTLELRPSYFSWNGFVLDKTQLIPTARETFDGIFVVLETAAQEAAGKTGGNGRPAPTTPTQVLPRKADPSFVPAVPTTTVHSGVCRDTVEDCTRWLFNSPGLCATSKNAMRRQCALTCGFC